MFVVASSFESLAHDWHRRMQERDGKQRDRFGENNNSSEKMFSLWFYYWMVEQERLNNTEIDKRLFADGWTYLAERVFQLPYNELELRYTEDDIYGVMFGDKGLLDMCRDTVDLRESEGKDKTRPLHEGLGMWNLLELLKKVSEGETIILVSPPDPDDPNMGGYNLVYLYEKLEDHSVRMGIITDDRWNIEDWRDKAKKLSSDKYSFEGYDHLNFVAEPFIANSDFGSIKKELLGDIADVEVPKWAIDQLGVIIPHIREAIIEGKVRVAEELFNAFKIAVTSKLLNKEKEIDPVRLVKDRWYFHDISAWYMQNGGSKYLNKRTGCSIDRIDLSSANLFNNQFSRFTKFDLMKYKSGDQDSGSEKLHEGDKACYQCPVCENEGHRPGGDVYLRGGYLVCENKPAEHRLKYDSNN